jgi:uncharacterized membrane protein YgaE (UPF0421/DUF939 family)
MARRIARSALQLSVRAAMAATLAVVVAQSLGMPGPIYAMISGVIVTDLDPAKSRGLALPRILGTVLGTLLGVLFAPAFALGAWTIGPAIVAAMLLAHVLRKPEAAKLAGYVCALVMLTHGGDAWAYAWWRCVETLIGIGAGVLVSFVPKFLRDPPGGREQA